MTAALSKLPRIALVCLAAEVLNFACVLLFRDALRVPLFADTVGTVAATFCAGLVPGLVVAVLFNVLRALQLAAVSGGVLYPWDMVYALCGAAIVLCTWIFARRRENFRVNGTVTVLYLVLIALVSAFASSIVGGVVEAMNRWLFTGMAYTSPIEHFVRAFLGESLGLPVACVIARIPVSVLDRLVCTFAGFGIYRLAAEKGGLHCG